MSEDYYGKGTYECIQVIRAWELNFELGNVLKYVKRAGHKNPRTRKKDLRKAVAYLEMELARPIRRSKTPEPEGPPSAPPRITREMVVSPGKYSRASALFCDQLAAPVSLEDRLEELFAEAQAKTLKLREGVLVHEEAPSAAAVDLVALRYDEPQEGT
jgi:hypothetical protein